MRAIHRAALVTLACAALLAAGCGGGSADGGRYVERVNQAQQDFAAQVDRLSKGITATSSEASDRRTMRSFQQAVDAVEGDLRRISPPPEVRTLHGTLIEAVDGYAAEVRQVGRALDSHSPARLRAAQRELSRATTAFGTTINRTIDAINRRLGS